MTVNIIKDVAVVNYDTREIKVDDMLNIPFQYLDNDEYIKVFLRLPDKVRKDLVLDTDYEVVNSNGTNNVWGVIQFKKAFSEIESTCIYRDIDNAQARTFDSQTMFAETTEQALDKLTMLYQDSQFKEYTIHAPIDDMPSKDSLQLPVAEKRANKYLMFDSLGHVTVDEGTDGNGRSLRQEYGENPDPSFELSLVKRKGQILGFDDEGHVKYIDTSELGEQSDWLEQDTEKTSYIKNKPELAAVATSGNYNDLTNKLTAGENIKIGDDNVISADVLNAVVVKGNDWTEKTLSFSGYWRSVTYGNDRFVAVAYNSNKTMYSYDGINWTEITLPSSANWVSVTYGDGKFVAVANDSNKVMYMTFEVILKNAINYKAGDNIEIKDNEISCDVLNAVAVKGNNWTAETTLPSSASWRSVTYGAGKFVAVAQNSDIVAYSYDGINWTDTALPSSANWYSVTYGAGKFVTVGYNSTKVAYSYDGINWTEKTLSFSGNWYSVTYGAGKFVAVANNSTKTMYSSDGINWTEITLPSSAGWSSVTYGDGKFVAVATSSTKVAYSYDGINWTEKTLPSSAYWYSVTYGDGKFVTVGYNSTKVAYSYDGMKWEETTMPSSAYWYSVTYGAGRFVTVGYNSDKVMYSYDGIDWAVDTLPSSATWRPITYGNGKFVVVATGSNKVMYMTFEVILKNAINYKAGDNIEIKDNEISCDVLNIVIVKGNNWTETTMPSFVNWHAATYGNGVFVVVAEDSNEVTYSYDGITWLSTVIKPITQSYAWRTVTYGDGKFVAVALNSGIVAYSYDGINWTAETTSLSIRGWHSVTYGNGKFVVVAYNSNTVAYSYDGINWTEKTLSFSGYWRSVIYGDGKFVAVATSSTKAAYSYDGINWTETTMPSSANWRFVTYGNGKFVALAEGSSTAAYSYDGIHWTEKILPLGFYHSVTYGNGRFVAISSNPIKAAYSYDGINWTETTMPSSASWYIVTFGNGKFVAISNSPTKAAYMSFEMKLRDALNFA